MADEAHRSQYGLTEKVVVRQKEDGEVEAKTIIALPGLFVIAFRTLHTLASPALPSLLKIGAPVRCSVIISTFTI